jgi:ribosomal protein S4
MDGSGNKRVRNCAGPLYRAGNGKKIRIESHTSHLTKKMKITRTYRKHTAAKIVASANPGGVARIEAATPESLAARLEARAMRLYALRLVDPRAPQYALADSLMDQARAIRA